MAFLSKKPTRLQQQQIVDRQNATHQTAIASAPTISQTRDQFEENVIASGTDTTAPTFKAPVDETTQEFRENQLANAKVPDQTTTLGTRIAALREPLTPGSSENMQDFQARRAANASELAALETSLTEQSKRKQLKTDADTAAKGTTTPAPAPNLALENMKNLAASDPMFADLLPMIADLESRQGAGFAEQQLSRDLTDFNSSDTDGDGITDGLQESVSNAQTLLKADKDEQDKINLENRDIALDAATLQKEMAQIAQKKFELNQARNENLLREQNVESEIRNRRIAGRMGITADTNGLKWMGDEIRKGNEALAFLSQAGDLQDAEFALQIGSAYNLSVRQALNGYEAVQSQLDTGFRKELGDLTNLVSLDSKERRKEKKGIMDTYWKNKNEADVALAAELKEYRTEMWDRIKTKGAQDFELFKEQNKAAAAYTDKDALDWSTKWADHIDTLQTVKDYKEVGSKVGVVQTAWKNYQEGKADRSVVTNAIIKGFERINDPGSVVRESEFAMTANLQPLIERWTSGAAVKTVFGGVAVSDEVLKDIVDLSEAIHESYRTKAVEDLQPTLMRIESFNRNAARPIQYNEVINQDMIDALGIPVSEFEQAEANVGGSSKPVTINDSTGFLNALASAHQDHEGFIEPNDKNPKGSLAYRNNNPGNLRLTSANASQYGAVAGDGGFARFPTYEAGFEALKGDLYAKLTGGSSHINYSANPTILDYIKVYAPSSDGNDPKGYASVVVRAMKQAGFDISLDTPLSQIAAQLEGMSTVASAPEPVMSVASPADLKPKITTGTGRPGMTGNSLVASVSGPTQVNTRFQYRTKDGGVVSVSAANKAEYDARPDLFTPIS